MNRKLQILRATQITENSSKVETFPELKQTDSGKLQYVDGKREYHTEETAHNALRGFRKFTKKRDYNSQLLYRVPYAEFEQQYLTKEERKVSNK